MALYRSPLTVTLWPSSFLKKYGPMIPPAHKAHQTPNRVCIVTTMQTPSGCRSWLVAGLLYLRLRVQPQPKSVDFPDAENRERPCRTVKRHEKDPLSVHLAWMLSAKLNS
ncbi:hypothetical protein TNCV_2217831 [Trichonephila clavipes]|nr:hypothetical protein TNCV_2217831 [Trichonephila clavipes]